MIGKNELASEQMPIMPEVTDATSNRVLTDKLVEGWVHYVATRVICVA